ncbi:hypothetical protein DN745_07605 [Bradymonas sediminis]|uniref:Uncharacterized protein n=1 Tax=Bradymonas sediminis TaxID=1548548 RepID=A0A2Z4FJU8_9DELT|nr:hypothetical protein DN745_07605 [Bradymonas sediminis]
MSLVAACDNSNKTPAGQEGAAVAQAEPADEKASEEPAEKPEGEKAEDAAPEEAKKERVIAPEDRVEVSAMEFKKENFPGKLPAGEVLGGIAFVDSLGDNYVVFTRNELPSQKEYSGNTALHIKHMVKKGDEVREVRSYVEKVLDCEFDTILTPEFGDWSVADLDNDGIGEAIFAYTADCTSDLSPNKYKLFVTEDGAKYVLRGRTAIKEEGMEPMGGEFKADEMPDAFSKKAEELWTKLSRKVWQD